jgi:hypothetical protein
MGYYHYHVARCPYCHEESMQRGCRLDNCGFATVSREPVEGYEQEECPRCGETFWVDYGDHPKTD